MTPEGITHVGHSGTDLGTSTARAHCAEADHADYVNPESLVSRVNAYGKDADVVDWHRAKRIVAEARALYAHGTYDRRR